MTQYLIEAIRIAPQFIDYRGGQNAEVGKLKWEATFPTIEAADAEWQKLPADRSVLAAALVEWIPGRLEPEARLRHGNYAARCCLGGVPTQKLVRHGERTWTCYNAGATRCRADDDWHDKDGAALDLTTQPAPGYRLSPRMGTGTLPYFPA